VLPVPKEDTKSQSFANPLALWKVQAGAGMGHLAYIDAVRGIAIAGVIALHTSQVFHPHPTVNWIAHFGADGVQLFYTVSAYTLALSMVKRDGTERRPVRNFFLRRFFRIAPLFYLMFVVYFFLSRTPLAHIMNASQVSWIHGLAVLTFLNGWRPDTINRPVLGQWSIAIEMIFYLLLPLIAPFVGTFRRAVVAWWIALGIFLVSFPAGLALAVREGFSPTVVDVRLFASWWFPSQLPIFMGGLGLFLIVRYNIPARRYLPPYLCGITVLLLVRHFYHDTYLTPIYGVLFILGISYLARHPVPWLVNRASVFLGKVSFSAYLCHLLFLDIVVRVFHGLQFWPTVNFSIAFAATLVLTCPASWCLWRYCEQPFQAMGRRLIRSLEARERIAGESVAHIVSEETIDC